MLSIKEAIERKAALETQAEQVWRNLATELALKIPKSCHKFAMKKGWHLDLRDYYWALPEFLEFVVKETKLGHSACIELRENHLLEKDYGFTNSDDLQAKMKELKQAWSDWIRIEFIVLEEGFRTFVKFYAVEFELKENELVA